MNETDGIPSPNALADDRWWRPLSRRGCQLGASRYQARQTVVEAARIYATLDLRSTSRVADVGAGTGVYSLELARELAPDGYVYATEIDLGRLAAIRMAVSEAGLDNVTTLESGGTKTGLPPSCCDGVFFEGCITT